MLFGYALPEQPKKRGRKKELSYIGQLGATKNTLNGKIDIAVMQTLGGKSGVGIKAENLPINREVFAQVYPAMPFERFLPATRICCCFPV